MSQDEEKKVEEEKVEEVPKVASVEDYRRMSSRLRKVTAPSGLIFEVKRLTPMDYIREGLKDIPNEFFKFITSLVDGKVEDPESEAAKKNFEMFEQFLKITVEQGIVNPPCLVVYEEDKKDTHLVYGELEAEDQSYLVSVITGRTQN